MGITDIFTDDADLSKISKKEKLYIDTAVHKANIVFSNDGIKASAATAFGGKGAAACKFDYFYEPEIEEIDITFDKPYLYLIIDSNTKEVWFTGTVYEPKEMKKQ
jgi:serpin B